MKLVGDANKDFSLDAANCSFAVDVITKIDKT